MPGLILARATLSSWPVGPNHHQSPFMCHEAVYQNSQWNATDTSSVLWRLCGSCLFCSAVLEHCSQVSHLYRNACVLSCVSRRLLLLVFLSSTLILSVCLSPTSKHINKSLYPWFFITASLALSLKVYVWALCFVHFFFVYEVLDMPSFWTWIIPDYT